MSQTMRRVLIEGEWTEVPATPLLPSTEALWDAFNGLVCQPHHDPAVADTLSELARMDPDDCDLVTAVHLAVENGRDAQRRFGDRARAGEGGPT